MVGSSSWSPVFNNQLADRFPGDGNRCVAHIRPRSRIRLGDGHPLPEVSQHLENMLPQGAVLLLLMRHPRLQPQFQQR